MSPSTTSSVVARALAVVLLLTVLGACEAGVAPPTPPVVAGASDQPRAVNIIAKDYSFLPEVVDLVPGETVVLHVINGGLEVHEAVIGDAAVQDAWEIAEAATVGAPPGPTPLVSVPPGVSGIRIVVESGERVDLVWTVPRRGRHGNGLGRRLPHPGALGAGHAGPGPMGRRRGPVAPHARPSGSGPRWYALHPRRLGAR